MKAIILGILDLRKTSPLFDEVSDGLEWLLSDEGVALATSPAEKGIIRLNNESKAVRILCTSSILD